MRFCALDFETANRDPITACAIGLVSVESGRIARRIYRLVRPPTERFLFTNIHGLTAADVRHAPDFSGVWADLAEAFFGASFIAAHNAAFDSSVLLACCRAHQLPFPGIPLLCTAKLARDHWGIHPANLPNVCRVLGIPLRHHQALSDAEACAHIVLRSRNQPARDN